jgi:hypothetical protein
MSEPKPKPIKSPAESSTDPVHVVRKGAVAASIWQRQSPSGYAYFDFSLSRSWKSLTGDRTGYSKNFFETNEAELLDVIQQASAWVAERKAQLNPSDLSTQR